MKPIWILGAGILLRLALATLRIDRIWADEHYQTLEPAYYLLHGHGYLSWEWREGFRSWSLPLLHTPILALSWLLGFKGGIGATILARSVYAILDAWIWYRLAGWIFPEVQTSKLDDNGNPQLQKTLFLFIALLSPTLALWGVTTLQDHLVMLMFWGLIPTLLTWSLSLRPLSVGLSAFLLFAIAIPKPQMALLCLGTAAGMLWLVRGKLHSPAGKKALLAMGAGSLAAGLLAGVLDWATMGRFAGTILNQLARGEAISRTYGVSPFAEYFYKIPDLLGWSTLVALLPLALLAGYSRPNARARELFTATAPGVFLFLAVHMAIPHKEIRFLLPLVPAFFLAMVACQIPTPKRYASFFRELARRLAWFKLPSTLAFNLSLLIPDVILCVIFWFSVQSGLGHTLYYTSVEVGRLEEWIRKDWRANQAPSSQATMRPIKLCVLGGNWSFMRGSLALESPVEYVSAFYPHELESVMPQSSQCHYVIAKQEWNFRSLATQPEQWRLIEVSQNGFELFKRLKTL